MIRGAARARDSGAERWRPFCVRDHDCYVEGRLPKVNNVYLVLLGAAVMGVLSCSSSTSDGEQGIPCPFTRLTGRVLSGEITFTVGGGVPETHPLRAEAETGPGDCIVQIITDEMPDTNNGITAPGRVYVACETGQATVIVVQDIIAPWRLGPGDQAVAQDPPYGELHTRACDAGGQLGTTTIDVEQGVGGSAPYPAVVTPDYQRVYTIHIEVATTVDSGFPPCVMMSATINARFSETAADAVNYPENRCLPASPR